MSLIIFLPAVGALVLCVLPVRGDQCLKRFSLLITFVVFLLTVWAAIPAGGPANFEVGKAGMQCVVQHEWIPSFNIQYYLGLDGISLPLVLLTSFLSVLAMWASWGIDKNVRAYCAFFLLLETGMLGVFLALDFFLFYVFWEVMLLPMYFLIGVWGGPRREYAAIKFFLFTLAGSVLMLIAILVLFYNSDPHTFSITELARIGQMPDSPFSKNELLWGRSVSWWAFVLLFIGFAVKLPSVPIHTWLPDAHVEAPTPISMILAGVLLKMGGYGIIRICYPICPDAGYELAWWVCGLGTVSMVYGALAAMAQKDFKRLVAYSSVSHMGYVLLGIGVWSATAGTSYNTDYWTMGMSGAMFQMIAHGISSAGMFFLVGVVYDRVHHRDLDRFGGLFPKMPVYAGISMIIFFAALGLPGLCGFWGELFVVLGTWSFSKTLAVIAASVVILTAGYILWTIQRVYLGPEYKGPHAEALRPMSLREKYIAVPLVVMAILFGVYPKALFDYVAPSVEKTVVEMKNWTENVAPSLKKVGWDKRSAVPPSAVGNVENVVGQRCARPTLLATADEQEAVQP
ncbi:MAG: NADH-quinone oxidoreductase subunit M [Pirellulales bacterium]|nr:NADH-quinone oxidoreductase subunit M [Pirellulales bacterium]